MTLTVKMRSESFALIDCKYTEVFTGKMGEVFLFIKNTPIVFITAQEFLRVLRNLIFMARTFFCGESF
jgi:hypothetical protein